MGSLRTPVNSPALVQYTNVIKILKSIERLYEGTSFEILVEPRIPGTGTAYRYIIDDEIDLQNIRGNRNLHQNGSLKRRIYRAKQLQKNYEILLRKSTEVLHRIRNHYKGQDYKLSLIKTNRQGRAFKNDEAMYGRVLPGIYLRLDAFRSRSRSSCSGYNMSAAPDNVSYSSDDSISDIETDDDSLEDSDDETETSEESSEDKTPKKSDKQQQETDDEMRGETDDEQPDAREKVPPGENNPSKRRCGGDILMLNF